MLDHTLNRVTVRLAKWGRGPFSLIRHVGRKTGRAYETPVILTRVPEGFVAELTYGDSVNWYRNVVAAGGCVVFFRGKEYRVSRSSRTTPSPVELPIPRPPAQSSNSPGETGSGSCASRRRQLNPEGGSDGSAR